MKLYTNYIKAHWQELTLHAVFAVICFVVADTPLEVLLISPVLFYALSAVSVDLDESGYAMLFILTEEPDVPLAKKLSEDLVDEVARDVKTVIITGDSLTSLREQLLEDEDDEDED